MSIDFTRPNLFRAILYFILLYALFRYRELFPDAVPAVTQNGGSNTMPIQKWLAGFIESRPVWREILLSILSLSAAFSVTRILSRNLIYLERTFIPLIIYPLVAFGFYYSVQTPVTLITALLIVFAVGSMIKSHKREENFGYFLHAAVALGFAPLLYAPTIVFAGLLPIGFILFRQNWRSVLSALLGYAAPFLFCSYLHWGMGGDFGDAGRQIIAIVTSPAAESFHTIRIGLWDYIPAGIFLILIVFGLANFSRNRTSTRRRALRGFSIFVWVLVVSLGMFALPARSLDMLPILAVPLAAVIPAGFNRQSGWIPNLLYFLMIWSVLIYNLFLIFPDLLS